jgi:hypothetical protein
MPAVERSSGEQSRVYAFRGPEVRRITAEQFADAIGAITGDWHAYQPAPGARPQVPSTPAPVPQQSAGALGSDSNRNLSAAAHSGVGDPGTPGVEAARAKALAAGVPAAATVPTNVPAANLTRTAAAATAQQAAQRAVEPGLYTREWRVASSPLTRALGRPIRDQVYSTRDSQATTLQALELVNGEVLTHWLSRGARKMLGELPPEPVSIFDHPLRGRASNPAPFEVDISGADKLWLIVQDTGSYSPELVEAVWAGIELVGPDGAKPVSTLKPLDDKGLRPGAGPITAGTEKGHGVRVKTPSRVVYEIPPGGFTRVRGFVGLENKTITSDINPQVRFMIFREEPNMERLTPVTGSPPLPAPPQLESAAEIVDRVFWYALGRGPSKEEQRAAVAALKSDSRPGRPSAKGLADVLWALLMKPEFQLIY